MGTSDLPGAPGESDDLLRGGTGERGTPADSDADADLLEGGRGSAGHDHVGSPPDQRDPGPDVGEEPTEPEPDAPASVS